MNENICAISTSLGVGAISIVRCSGPDVVEIVNKIFKGKNLKQVNSHTINYGYIVDNDNVIDEVLVSVMLAPKTFTLEDVVEINTHGGISPTNRVLELLIQNGCRLAEPGEFTKKAFLNGRIDLIEAEGINDLVSASTDDARVFALSRVEGKLSTLINNMRSKLVSLEAKLEVNYDYPEEIDNIEMTHEMVLSELNSLKKDMEELVSESQMHKIIKDGIDVAIIGRPNVGKSSILNHLLNENKAIVTNIAGTTRDIVEGSIVIDGLKLNLIDTAGIRLTDDIVEKIGVDKSKDIMNKSDLVIVVLNNNESLSTEEINLINEIKTESIIFVNKNDLTTNLDITSLNETNIIYGNTLDEFGLDSLKNKIKELFNLEKIKAKDYNILSNAREIGLVKSALDSINNGIEATQNELPLEMISVDIKDAYDILGEVIGDTYKDGLLDELFSKFCLGK